MDKNNVNNTASAISSLGCLLLAAGILLPLAVCMIGVWLE